MKFLNKDTKTIIETSNKTRIAKFKGYPDKFEEYTETKTKKSKAETKTK